MGAVTNFSATAVYIDRDTDDLGLVARCRAGDMGGFEALVQRYQRVLFTVSLRILGDDDAPNDAAQNAFRILVNECLNARRDAPRHEPLAPDLAAAGTPADHVESAERRRAVQAAIHALPMD